MDHTDPAAPTRPGAGRQARRRLLGAGAMAPLLGASTALLVAGCATPAVTTPGGRPLPEPRLRAGDRWVYREVNRFNGSEVARVQESVTAVAPVVVVRTEVLPSEFSAGRVQRAAGPDEGRFADRWQVLRELIYDYALDFDDPMPLLPDRLLVGQQRSDRTHYRVRGLFGRYGWRQRLRSLSMATVETPAGRFDTLRVERLIDFDATDPFRSAASRHDVLYYAPEINRWVVREWRGQYRHETTLDDLGGGFVQEDWIRRELVDYAPAA